VASDFLRSGEHGKSFISNHQLFADSKLADSNSGGGSSSGIMAAKK
jgi:hypothetical protein